MPDRARGIVRERLRERLVRRPALVLRAALGDRRAHQRMPEAQPQLADLDQAGVDRRGEHVERRAACSLQPARGGEHLGDVRAVGQRGDQQRGAGGLRQVGDARRERPLQPRAERQPGRQLRPPPRARRRAAPPARAGCPAPAPRMRVAGGGRGAPGRARAGAPPPRPRASGASCRGGSPRRLRGIVSREVISMRDRVRLDPPRDEREHLGASRSSSQCASSATTTTGARSAASPEQVEHRQPGAERVLRRLRRSPAPRPAPRAAARAARRRRPAPAAAAAAGRRTGPRLRRHAGRGQHGRVRPPAPARSRRRRSRSCRRPGRRAAAARALLPPAREQRVDERELLVASDDGVRGQAQMANVIRQ